MGASHAQKSELKQKWPLKMLFVVIAVIALAGAMAVLAITDSRAAGQTNLTLQQALDMALANNSQIYLAGVDVNSAQLSYDQAKQSADSLQQQINATEANGVPVVVTQEMAMVLTVAPDQAKLALDLSDRVFDYTINSIRYGVTAAYYGLAQAQEALTIAQDNLETVQKQCDDMQAKYTNGTVSKLELLNAKTAVSNAQCDVTESRNTVDSLTMTLNQLIGQDVHTQLHLTNELSYSDSSVDRQGAYEQALTTDATVCAAKMSGDSAKMLENFYQQYRGDNDSQYDSAKMSTRKAETSYNQAKISLEIAVTNAYNELQSARQSYQAMNESLEVAAEAAHLTQVRYENGLGTISDVNTANNTYLQVRLGALSALCKYNLAQARFSYGVYEVSGSGSSMMSSSASSSYSSAMSSNTSLTLLLGIVQGLIEQWGLDNLDLDAQSILDGTAFAGNANNETPAASTYAGSSYTGSSYTGSVYSGSSSAAKQSSQSSSKRTGTTSNRDSASPSSSSSSSGSLPIELQNGSGSSNNSDTPSDLNPSSDYGTYAPGGAFAPAQ